MKSIRAVILGAVLLAVLDGIVSHQGDAAAVGGAWKFANTVLEKFLSPAVGIFGTTPAAKQPAASTTAAVTTTSAAPAAATASDFFAAT